MGIPYSEVVTILGFQMASETETSRRISWPRVTASVKKQASEVYQRDLGLSRRILYAHAYLLAKIWHTAQIFPNPKSCAQQIVAAIVWYIWRGSTFRVPVSTLQRLKGKGGWRMADVEMKCRACENVGAKSQKGICASGVATLLEYPKVWGKPPNSPEDTTKARIFICVCGGHTLCEGAASGRNAKSLSETGIRHDVYFEQGGTIAKGDEGGQADP
jgi:hypothetical protein